MAQLKMSEPNAWSMRNLMTAQLNNICSILNNLKPHKQKHLQPEIPTDITQC